MHNDETSLCTLLHSINTTTITIIIIVTTRLDLNLTIPNDSLLFLSNQNNNWHTYHTNKCTSY